jgi:Mce-associated membrane protein
MTAKRAVGVLAVLVVPAAAVLGWLVLLAEGTAGRDTTSAESSDAVVASAGTKADVLEAAADATTRAYSYSWDTLGEDRSAARAMMTREMQRRYDRTMAGVGTSSRTDHTVVSAEVVESALVTATSSYARVLLFVNQTTDGDDLDEPLLDLDRVLVTLVHDDGAWRLDELDAL